MVHLWTPHPETFSKLCRDSRTTVWKPLSYRNSTELLIRETRYQLVPSIQAHSSETYLMLMSLTTINDRLTTAQSNSAGSRRPTVDWTADRNLSQCLRKTRFGSGSAIDISQSTTSSGPPLFSDQYWPSRYAPSRLGPPDNKRAESLRPDVRNIATKSMKLRDGGVGSVPVAQCNRFTTGFVSRDYRQISERSSSFCFNKLSAISM
jgi:hypothetical protein